MTVDNNVEVEVALPIPGMPLFTVVMTLAFFLVWLAVMDIYMLKHQKRIHNRPYDRPTRLPMPPDLVNWCGHRTVILKESLYKKEYDLTLLFPYIKKPNNYLVLYKLYLFVWIPIETSLSSDAPFISMFIFPQVNPKQLFMFDFASWKDTNQGVVRLRNLTNGETYEGTLLARTATNSSKLNNFSLEDMTDKKKKISYKTYHAYFTFDLSHSLAKLESCKKDSTCVNQLNVTVKLDVQYEDAVFLTLGQDNIRGRKAPMIQQNETLALCCELFQYEGNGLKKLCRQESTNLARDCTKRELEETCWDYGKGYQ